MSGLNIERILAAAVPVGIAQAAIDCAFPYAHERKQFDTPIGEFQLIQGTETRTRPKGHKCGPGIHDIRQNGRYVHGIICLSKLSL